MNRVIEPLDTVAMAQAKARLDSIAKPLNSLGKLEQVVISLAGIAQTQQVCVDKKCTVVMCADNGIVAQGVTQTGQEVTKIVAENMTHAKATIAILSARAGSDVKVVDIGIASDVQNPAILHKKVRYGTADFTKELAMTRQEAQKAVQIGIDLVGQLKAEGYQLIATGEMGIGNTTTSSALTACLLGLPAVEVTGRGAGLSSTGLQRKIEVIEEGIALHQPDPTDILDLLSKVGGLDIAGLVGVFLGGGIHRVPVLIDGFISSVAALLAVTHNPMVKPYLFATHLSKEPAGKLLLDALGLPAMFDLDMCLGEGTGAVMAFPVFDAGVSVYHQMTSFEETAIEAYQPLD